MTAGEGSAYLAGVRGRVVPALVLALVVGVAGLLVRSAAYGLVLGAGAFVTAVLLPGRRAGRS